MKFFVLFLLQLSAIFSSTFSYSTNTPPTATQVPNCPDGFTALITNDIKCVQVSTTKKLFTDASDACRSFTGGNLVSIHSSIDNRALANIATSSGSADPIWIGLVCNGTDYKNPCTWTDGTKDYYYYDNFLPGNPNLNVGVYGYMLQSGGAAGKWVTADEYTELGYFCEAPLPTTTRTITSTTTPTTTPTPYCREGFSSLNDKICVKLIVTPMIYQNASSICKSFGDGGNLVSIYSSSDNTELLNMAKFYKVARPIWLGLNCQYGGVSFCDWTDGSGTTYDYNNFARGNPSYEIGTRAYMLTSGNSAGQWVSAEGDFSYYSIICEVPLQYK